MKFKKVAMVFGGILLVILLLVGLSTYRGFTGGQLIDVTALRRSDHRLFAGEKRADNSIDYVAAIDRITAEGVAPEENFGVTTMELAADDSELRPVVRNYFANTLPFDENCEYRFLNHEELAARIAEIPTAANLVDLIHTATVDSFVEAGSNDKMLRDLIELESAKLDFMLRELDRRPKYYVPVYDPNNSGTVISLYLPHSQIQRDFGRWLTLRSNQRIADGKLADAWRDIRGIYQLSNRVSQGFTTVESVIGFFLNQRANQQLHRLLNSPELTPDLVDLIAADLPHVSQRPPWTDSLDLGERAMILNAFDKMVEGQLEIRDLVGTQLGSNVPSERSLPLGWVDSVKLADDWNQWVDRIIAAEKQGNAECVAELEEYEDELADLQFNSGDMGRLISKAIVGATPRKEGTKMAEALLVKTLAPALQQVHAMSVRAKAQTQLLQLALAARKYEFENQKLPASLEHLEPLVDRQVIIDPFSGDKMQLQFVSVPDGEYDPTGENPVLRIISAGNYPPAESWRIDLLPANQ